MINPFDLTRNIEKQVCKDHKKKFYRFRKTRFYGGCATADCVGCNLRCAYCWAQHKVWHPKKFGTFYTIRVVSERLIKMNLSFLRISGGEPTICKKYLINLINLIPEDKQFILETNGILLDEDYIRELSKFNNLFVRVSLKGVDERTFEKITGAEGKFFYNQLNTLDLLKEFEIKHRAALMVNLFTQAQIDDLGIDNIEYEILIEYPFVLKGLKKRGIKVKRLQT
ncbi:MAG: radical SAM protein [Promethearchaeota archaeon]